MHTTIDTYYSFWKTVVLVGLELVCFYIGVFHLEVTKPIF